MEKRITLKRVWVPAKNSTTVAFLRQKDRDASTNSSTKRQTNGRMHQSGLTLIRGLAKFIKEEKLNKWPGNHGVEPFQITVRFQV